ncbi:MAG TPA: hypothetical protein VG983_08085 [Caulobacterales bacterium]|jgi:hypothetical protein|nr:hypothetical protein [Caulobacterales bacterium]
MPVRRVEFRELARGFLDRLREADQARAVQIEHAIEYWLLLEADRLAAVGSTESAMGPRLGGGRQLWIATPPVGRGTIARVLWETGEIEIFVWQISLVDDDILFGDEPE